MLWLTSLDNNIKLFAQCYCAAPGRRLAYLAGMNDLFGPLSSDDEDGAVNCQQPAAFELLFEERKVVLSPDYPAVLVRESDFSATNANVAWPSNAIFVNWLLEHRELLEGRNVLDLGAGTGVLAIFLRRHVPGMFIATSDYPDDDITDNIAHNWRLNGLTPAIHISHKWGDPFPFDSKLPPAGVQPGRAALQPAVVATASQGTTCCDIGGCQSSRHKTAASNSIHAVISEEDAPALQANSVLNMAAATTTTQASLAPVPGSVATSIKAGNVAANFDVILANDILLYVNSYPVLATTLAQLLARRHGNICIMAIGRNLGKDNERLFMAEVAKVGLEHKLVGKRIYLIEPAAHINSIA